MSRTDDREVTPPANTRAKLISSEIRSQRIKNYNTYGRVQSSQESELEHKRQARHSLAMEITSGLDLIKTVMNLQKSIHMDEKTESNSDEELPPWFMPSELDVICGWARQNYHHGKSLRSIVWWDLRAVMSSHHLLP